MAGVVTAAAAFALVAAMVAPAPANATLAFVRNAFHPVVYEAADNGTGAHRIGPGRDPRVTPDGQTILFLREGAGHSQNMLAVAATGGTPRKLMTGWRSPFYTAISPDSSLVAALTGGELGKQTLVLVNIATGSQLVVAQGYFSGISFSPDGTELAYSMAGSERFPPRSDIYRFNVHLGEAVRFMPPVRITSDQNSQDPLWGPAGTIVFVKTLGASHRKYGPKNELYLMSPQGGEVNRLTHTKVDPLLQGLFPTDWSADGHRLLAEFEGQDTSYAVVVNPRTGSQRPLGKARERGLIGAALSSDGSAVLATTGGFEPGGPGHNVVSVPYSGHGMKVLARNAFEPSWSR